MKRWRNVLHLQHNYSVLLCSDRDMIIVLHSLTQEKVCLPGSEHRVDSVIEGSLREIIGSKNFILINLSLNFCEMTIYDNKVFLENLVAVH